MAPVSKDKCCRICDSDDVQNFSAREMMFGLRDTFLYFECKNCGCVQIASYPEDVARFYPSDYYSFKTDGRNGDEKPEGSFKTVAKAVLMQIPIVWKQWLNRPSTKEWLARTSLIALYASRLPESKARILDVGCGDGALLRKLQDFGYRNAEGVDPFIAADVTCRGKRLVSKRKLEETTGLFDCISFHHALEHMPDQQGILDQARRLLTPSGILMIRIPTVEGEAWRTYRENWVQLDPPRHFYLHSTTSLKLLARQCGLMVQSLSYDSTDLQFWGSELYSRNMSLLDSRSPAKGSHDIFSAQVLENYGRRARELNASFDGDQIVAVLTQEDQNARVL